MLGIGEVGGRRGRLAGKKLVGPGGEPGDECGEKAYEEGARR